MTINVIFFRKEMSFTPKMAVKGTVFEKNRKNVPLTCFFLLDVLY